MIVCNSTTSIEDNHHQMAYQSPPTNFLFQSDQDHHHNDQLASLLPQQFHGHPALLMKRSMSFDQDHHHQHHHQGVINGGDDDLSDDGSQLGEKKKRLNMEQVKTLERSFEHANKLDPDKKVQLARALGLQPRQVAIWFQNRRARSKTKQLERDYEVLKKQFDAVKADNDTLQSHNKKLLAQLLQLKTQDSNESYGIGLKKETEQGSWSNGSDNSSDINLDISTTTPAMNLCNMFGSMEDQPGMWTWPENQNFH